MADQWWDQFIGGQLAQGDFLVDCVVPTMPPEIGERVDGRGPYIFVGKVYDLIVLTQSCDLENVKAPLVATCPLFELGTYEHENPRFARKGEWERVRQGRVEGLHLLAALDNADDNRQALVVDFRQIYSLPVGYLERRAGALGPRPRLRSPYLEHFSQSFARFFMRVGLPSSIPRYR